MAYNTQDLEKEALEAIQENELVFFDEIANYVEPVIRTLYDHNLHEMQSIKNALKKNKLSVKKQLRDKWKKGDNATTQVALYKLLSDEYEFGKLSGQEVNHKNNGGSFNPESATTEELIKRAEASRSIEDAS